MIVCVRSVRVPGAAKEGYLAWIRANRTVREQHGILVELVLHSGEDEHMVITAWPSHEVFDAWIATSERGALTASREHASVTHHPITRYEVAGGYVIIDALAREYAP